MKRILTSVIAVFMLLSLVSCSLDGDVSSTEPTDIDTDTEVDETTVKSVETDEFVTPTGRSYGTLEEYEKRIQRIIPPENFIYYDDIRHLGEFYNFHVLGFESDYKIYKYGVSNGKNVYNVEVCHTGNLHESDFDYAFNPIYEHHDDDLSYYLTKTPEKDGLCVKYTLIGNDYNITYYYIKSEGAETMPDGSVRYELNRIVWFTEDIDVIISPNLVSDKKNYWKINESWQKLMSRETAELAVLEIMGDKK